MEDITLEEFVNDQRLIEILNFYDTENHSIGSQLKTAFLNSKQSRMVLPILGLQGMGKSSLLNALLGQNILPEGADETTCIPVEVRYGEKVEAKVHFNDNRQETTLYTRDELEAYVNNNMNKGNEKKVSCIELFMPVSLLKTGLTLVDLPGVGSMVRENGEIARRYAQNVSAAVFVIPCVPTIRACDAIFIKSQMAAYSIVKFVQNCWNDESPTDIKNSLDYNRKKLHEIAQSIGVQFSDDSLYPINVYKALHGSLNADMQEMQDSGLNDFVIQLGALIENWEQSCDLTLKNRLMQAVAVTKASISDMIYKLTTDHEHYIAEKEKELANFRKETEKQEEQIGDILNGSYSFKKTIKREAKKIATEHVAKIRSHIYEIIDKGLTDGDKLTCAFRQTQDQEINGVDGAAERIFDLMQEQILKLREQIDCFSQELENDKRINVQTQSFYHKIAFKFEGGWNFLGGIGGVIGGGAAMGAIAGPAGIAVGILVGLASSLLGILLGKIERKFHADKTKKELEPYFDKIITSIVEAADQQACEISDQINDMFEVYLEERKAEENRIISDIKSEEVIADLTKLQSDLSYLEE